MSEAGRQHDELYELIAAACDGQLTSAESARLEELLAADPGARRIYVQCLCSQSLLERFDRTAIPSVDASLAVCGSPLPAARSPLSAPHRAAHSPVLGFLSGLSGSMARAAVSHTVVVSLAVLVLLGVVGVGLFWAFSGSGRETDLAADRQSQVPDRGTSVPASEPAAPKSPVPLSSVARLTRVINCRWSKGAEPVGVGGDLAPGQQLCLAAGLAEIVSRKGVNLVLQGPAVLTVESDNGVFLAEGRLTARMTRPEARGFTVRTPQSSVIDEGTEFGVDVAPGGDQDIHVFQGEVRLDVTPRGGPAVAPRQLTENQGARMNAGTRGVALLADTGEGFTRSIEPTGRDPHVVAYWRFEDQPVGTLVPNTARSTNPVRGTVDSSGNGNDLFAWNPATAPRFSGDVPAAAVVPGGKANRGSLDNSAPLAPVGSRDLYTKSKFSHASPIDLQKISPVEWTVEVSVKPARLRQRVQVFVGRDGSEPWAAQPLPPRLGFFINQQDRFAIGFADGDGRVHLARAEQLPVEENHWYHVAATSDGHALRLYVDAIDGRGFQLQATTPLPTTGSTSLGVGSESSEWSIGRGRASNGSPGAWFQGWIDEVRISDVARQPSDFLFAANSRSPSGRRNEGNVQ
jgi:hypothetical protein